MSASSVKGFSSCTNKRVDISSPVKRRSYVRFYLSQLAWLYKTYIKIEWQKQDVELKVAFFRSGRRCDGDNLEKAFLDGLQYGGAFVNDNQVRRVEKEVFYIKKGEPFILFSIAPWTKDLKRWGIKK